MSNRYYTPVMFGLEKNIVHLYAKVSFGADGIPTLIPTDSKGICSVKVQTIGLTGGVVNSTTSIGSVSSFAGLYSGMTVTGTGVATANVISSMSVAGDSLTMTKQNITTGDDIALVASGGRFLFQFGSKEALNLDPYNKLLAVNVSFDMTASSAAGSATALALAPAAPQAFAIANSTSTRTVPQVATSGSSDCSLALQFGFGQGTSFSAYNPKAGEVLKVSFVFSNSTAM